MTDGRWAEVYVQLLTQQTAVSSKNRRLRQQRPWQCLRDTCALSSLLEVAAVQPEYPQRKDQPSIGKLKGLFSLRDTPRIVHTIVIFSEC